MIWGVTVPVVPSLPREIDTSKAIAFSKKLQEIICTMNVSKRLIFIVETNNSGHFRYFEQFVKNIGYTKQWALADSEHEELPLDPFEVRGSTQHWILKPATAATIDRIPTPTSCEEGAHDETDWL